MRHSALLEKEKAQKSYEVVVSLMICRSWLSHETGHPITLPLAAFPKVGMTEHVAQNYRKCTYKSKPGFTGGMNRAKDWLKRLCPCLLTNGTFELQQLLGCALPRFTSWPSKRPPAFPIRAKGGLFTRIPNDHQWDPEQALFA